MGKQLQAYHRKTMSVKRKDCKRNGAGSKKKTGPPKRVHRKKTQIGRGKTAGYNQASNTSSKSLRRSR